MLVSSCSSRQVKVSLYQKKKDDSSDYMRGSRGGRGSGSSPGKSQKYMYRVSSNTGSDRLKNREASIFILWTLFCLRIMLFGCSNVMRKHIVLECFGAGYLPTAKNVLN